VSAPPAAPTTLVDAVQPGATDPLDRVLRIQPWPDPVVDEHGHDPRSAYVERFWLPVLGPSTVFVLRRLADGLEAAPDGFLLDLRDLGRELGLVSRVQRSPLLRAVDRACVFGAARLLGQDTLLVRRRLGPVTHRQAQRLPAHLREELARWDVEDGPAGAPAEPLPADHQRRRARSLALSLLQLGETYEATERQLHRWRFHPALAHDAMRWAVAHWSTQARTDPIPDPGRAAPAAALADPAAEVVVAAPARPATPEAREQAPTPPAAPGAPAPSPAA
jgi:hypothetical protein